MSQPRNEKGHFEEKVTEQDILKVFDKVDEPVLTTSDVADSVEIGHDAVYTKLQKMHEKDLLGKKKTGARSVVWWAKVAPRLNPDIAADLEGDEEPTMTQEEVKEKFGIDV
ncbi:MAG: hypothetical protein SV377_06875 [Halobacteria archaeon]|nr:hypothetical protein [Halobacteria archaeon]